MKKLILLSTLLLMALGLRAEQSDSTPRIQVKLNSLIVIGVVNPAVEFSVADDMTVQLETWGCFYPTDFLGTDRPLVVSASFAEFRYYLDKAFNGFYGGAHIGYSAYKLNKDISVVGSDEYLHDAYQQGSNFMTGLTIGYQYPLSDHFSLEAFISGGWQVSVYEGYARYSSDGVYQQYAGVNKSGEWLPLYKGGISVGYRW